MISIEKYVALNNPKAAKEFLSKYGFEPASSIDDLVYKVESASLHFREKALEDLANIDTPYRRLILSSTESVDEGKSNCCGCSCKTEKSSNINGDDSELVNKIIEQRNDVAIEEPVLSNIPKPDVYIDKVDKYMPYILGFAGLATILILAKK